MSAQRYTTETIPQVAIILGAEPELSQSLINALKGHGIHASHISSEEALSDFIRTHDPDYILEFEGVGEWWVSLLAPLIQSGSTLHVVLTHTAKAQPSLSQNNLTKHLLYCDYVGVEELVSPTVQGWLKDISHNQPLSLPGHGLDLLSVIAVDDLSSLICTSLLRTGKSRGITRTLAAQPRSLLSLAYLIRTNIAKKIEIKFDENLSAPPPPTSGVEPMPDFPEALFSSYIRSHSPTSKSSLASSATEPQADLPPKKLTPLKPQTPIFVPRPLVKPRRKLTWPKLKPISRPRLRASAVVSRGLLFALGLYLGTLAFAATLSLLSLRHIFLTLKNNQLPAYSHMNQAVLTYARANWALLSSVPVVSKSNPVLEINQLLDIAARTLTTLKTANSLEATTTSLAHYVFGTLSGDPAALLSQSRLEVEELYSELSLLDGLLKETPPQILPAKYSLEYSSGRAKLEDLKRSVITAKALLAIAPDVIALGGRRKYGVLFQNNMELRATGGFIGSFGILSFENGKLYDLEVFDVYDADGQLKGHVEPPPPVKNILGEANWYLRDSNFDPDFPTSARRAEWFIQKSLGQDLDGVIALNVDSLVAILSATGPLAIPDYDETISAANLYERAQSHAEVNFFPGSTQKKEFLSSVASSLFAHLPQIEAGEGIALMNALAHSLTARSTLVSLKDATSAQSLKLLGWDGALLDLPCPALDHCHKDYTMVVDSNFGVNKANYFIKRNIEMVITMDKDLLVNHLLRLRYHNTASSTAWPAGVYKNYSRIYLPLGANVSAVSLDGRVLANTDYSLSAEHDRTVLSYLMNVPINSEVVVEVTYTTPQLSEDGDFVYSWYWQKQSGTSSQDNLTTYLNYPLYLTPDVISPKASLSPQQLKFELTNDADRRVTVKFSR